jgi:hypothetical protein
MVTLYLRWALIARLLEGLLLAGLLAFLLEGAYAFPRKARSAQVGASAERDGVGGEGSARRVSGAWFGSSTRPP